MGPFKQFEKRFENAYFIIASNRLPAQVETEEDKNFVSEIWEPIQTRTTFVELTQKMPESKSEHYTVNQLAHALLWLSKNQNV